MKPTSLKKTSVLLGFLLIAGFLLPTYSRAGQDTPFSAEHVIITPDGSSDMKGMIYYTPDKFTSDMILPQGIGRIVVLQLKKEKMTIMIKPEKKAYLVEPMEENKWPGLDASEYRQKEKLGTETISGYQCTKYSVVMDMPRNGRMQEEKVIIWESDKFIVPLKTRDQYGAVQELRNIKEGQPPAEVFQVPAGYKKVADIMELMIPE